MNCVFCKSDFTKKNGWFISESHRQMKVQRYKCRSCSRTFSEQTESLTYREHKPYVTQRLMRLLASGVSERRCAFLLEVRRRTVAKKLIRLGLRAEIQMQKEAPREKTEVVIFDEMETFEHTKCKPVSIPLAVDEKTRRILAIDVVPMPAKGKIAAKARAKYGRRMDGRRIGLEKVLTRVKHLAPNLTLLKSDKCPRYPGLVTTIFGDKLDHQTFKGRRGCVVGQGELKNTAHDPLFSLNHTCAMLRDNIKRLTRRTWTTTKCIHRLRLFVTLYAWVHNQLREGATWRLKMP